ncbi:signal peptidase II [Candidatus Microgenomates bacterium]|jgi:signal peptidase II|nr:MAG: signal peptidase II [Candidatus Microgenomates bacterium]
MRKRKGQVIFLLIVVLDQLAKFFFLKTGVLINKGISFGLFENPFFSKLLLFILPFFIAVFFVFSIKKFPRSLSLVLIIGGGLSNYLDRVIRGGVVDYLSFWLFPAFNLADAVIALGFALFLVDFRKKQKVS